MADEKFDEVNENEETELIVDNEYLLTDEAGEEKPYILIGVEELDNSLYLALVPKTDGENEEYVILRLERDEDGEDILVTIDDDEEFDKIAGVFDDKLFGDEEE